MTEPTKRRPGRPKGSRNRPKTGSILPPQFRDTSRQQASAEQTGEVVPLLLEVEDKSEPPPPVPVSPLRADVGMSDTFPRDAGKYPPPLVGVSGLQIAPEPPRGIRVVLALKVAMSTPGERVEVEWPPGYPLPSSGDLVTYGEVIGHVAAIEHRPAEALVVLHLR